MKMEINKLHKDLRIAFGEILGTIPSDGYLGPQTKGSGFNYILCSKDKEFVEHIISNFSKFNIKAKLLRRKTGLWYAEIGRKWLNNFLPYLRKHKDKWIFSKLTLISPFADFKAAVIRSFSDADGTVTCKVSEDKFYSRRIAIYNQSRGLLFQLKELLNSFGINSYIRLDRYAREEIINGEKVKFSDTYSLRITNYRNLEIFNREIGFDIPRKMDKLKLMLKSYKSIGREYQPEEYFNVLRLYNQIKNCREVSRRLKIPPQTVQNWALIGVKPRVLKTVEFRARRG